MKTFLPSLIACVTLALLVAGCDERKPADTPTPSASAPEAKPSQITDRWVGKWNGPEGTFLQLAGGDGRYEVTIRNLDGPRTFAGAAAGGQITFERDGAKETLRATNGAATGMKWLSEKADCLTVRAGEGYCRD